MTETAAQVATLFPEEFLAGVEGREVRSARMHRYLNTKLKFWKRRERFCTIAIVVSRVTSEVQIEVIFLLQQATGGEKRMKSRIDLRKERKDDNFRW